MSGPERDGGRSGSGGREREGEIPRAISRRRALRLTAVAGVAVAFGGALTREILERAGLSRVRSTRARLGTGVTVTVVHDDEDAARAMVEATFAEMERLESLLSRYRPETPVSRLARDGVVHHPPPELVAVLDLALELARETGGAFDPTVAPLVELYARRTEDGRGLPDPSEVEAALARVGYRKLELARDRIAFGAPGMALTLDGIAKGYVVDRAVTTLAGRGAGRVQVEAGGDLATSGSDLPGDGWEVDVRDPRDPEGSVGRVRLRGQGVATSGDYVQAFTRDLRHHHILDPRTGASPIHTSGVTVTAPTAMEADALSTTVFVLGPEEGRALLEHRPGVEGLIVGKDGARTMTGGFG